MEFNEKLQELRKQKGLTDEILTIAEESNKQNEKHLRDLVFGLLNCSAAMFLFLPFFGQRADNRIHEVSLLSLTGVEPYIKIPYLFIVFGIIICGMLTLALQNCESAFWLTYKDKISSGLSTIGTFFSSLRCIIHQQRYLPV